jgi:hypothetical protein
MRYRVADRRCSSRSRVHLSNLTKPHPAPIYRFNGGAFGRHSRLVCEIYRAISIWTRASSPLGRILLGATAWELTPRESFVKRFGAQSTYATRRPLQRRRALVLNQYSWSRFSIECVKFSASEQKTVGLKPDPAKRPRTPVRGRSGAAMTTSTTV